MRCCRRLLNILYKDYVTNEKVHRKIQATTGEYDELLTLVKKWQLRCFGHVSRSSGLAKTILQVTVKGKRRRGRQKKKWEDNIKEWTGMNFARLTRAAEDRTRWKGIVVNSSVVPQQPSADRTEQMYLPHYEERTDNSNRKILTATESFSFFDHFCSFTTIFQILYFFGDMIKFTFQNYHKYVNIYP